MPQKAKGVDPEAVALAKHFLDGSYYEHTEDDQRSLAETIQEAVEDWFAERE